MAREKPDLTCLDWVQPECEMISFPFDRRVGRIRDIAGKLVNCKTERHEEYFISQIDDAHTGQLERAGLSVDQISEQIAMFWPKVYQEVTRINAQNT